MIMFNIPKWRILNLNFIPSVQNICIQKKPPFLEESDKILLRYIKYIEPKFLEMVFFFMILA